MTGRQKKTTKRLAWLLTLFPCHFGHPSTAHAGGGEQPDRTGCDGGIRLSKQSGDEDRGK